MTQIVDSMIRSISYQVLRIIFGVLSVCSREGISLQVHMILEDLEKFIYIGDYHKFRSPLGIQDVRKVL